MFHTRHPHRGLFSPCSIAILTVVMGGLAASASAQTTRHVSLDGLCGGNTPCYATIQAAINAAVNGDEVLIAPGTYTAAGMTLTNKAITLRGGGGAAVTIIQAPTSTAIILTLTNVEQDTVLDGLTFDRGGALFETSGAVNISGSHPTLMNCVFMNADATAVHRQSGTGNMVVTNCQFLNNETVSTPDGGAMQIVTGTATITGCTFVGNETMRQGGAIWMAGGGIISGCTFEDSSIESGITPFGGAIFVANINSALLIDDCEFINNSTLGTGGAIYALRSAGFAAVTISNCQFTDNTGPTAGGGVYASGTPVSIVDCTFTDNSSSTGGGASLIAGASVTGGTFTNNLTSGGAAGRGAGLAVENAFATNCMFTGNQSTGNGGAMYVLGTTSILTNCNASGNSAGAGLGGGLNSAAGSMVTLVDSVLCTNTPENLEVGGLLNATNVITCDQPLGPVGACCLAQGGCVITTETNCVAAGGTYQGHETTCATAGCPEPTCVADIAPPGGDDAVNVLDLLKVINTWGTCP